MIQYFKLLKPPTLKFIDTLIYLLVCFLTAILIIPLSIVTKKTIKQAIFVIFPKLMLRDILINFYGVNFIARKRKSDILILNELSEPWMSEYFKIKEGDVVLDCGAHVGKYALPAAKMVGRGGIVIAIEPHPENYNALLKNISINGFENIRCFNVAALDRDGEKPLYGSVDSLYSLKEHNLQKSILVKTRTVDSVFHDLGLDYVDYVKIDVEGAEVEVLKGMKELIENSPNPKMQIEVWGENIKDVDGILEGFSKRILGGDNPNVLAIFYWKE